MRFPLSGRRPHRSTALTGNFEFNDDSLWWKGAAGRLPKSALKGDGVYNLNNGDLKLKLAATPASFDDFHWLYKEISRSRAAATSRCPSSGREPRRTTSSAQADVRTGSCAPSMGDIGVTIVDTVFFHDANVRFTGLTTKLIEEVAPGNKSPRPGVLSGRAKFSGTFKRLNIVSSDITFDAYNRGTSRVLADGIVGFRGTKKIVVSAKNLHVNIRPLQIDIVKLLFPLLPIGGTLTGVATLNGSGDAAAQRNGTRHRRTQDGANVSRAVGFASVHTTGRQTLDLDVIARPLALAELTKFAPSLPRKGVAFGPVKAHGPIDALAVDTNLALPGGGQFAMRGTMSDFLSKGFGYDVVADVTRLDLSWVVLFGPRTSLNGAGHAAGRGFLPATMFSDISLDLSGFVARYDCRRLGVGAREAGQWTWPTSKARAGDQAPKRDARCRRTARPRLRACRRADIRAERRYPREVRAVHSRRGCRRSRRHHAAAAEAASGGRGAASGTGRLGADGVQAHGSAACDCEPAAGDDACADRHADVYSKGPAGRLAQGEGNRDHRLDHDSSISEGDATRWSRSWSRAIRRVIWRPRTSWIDARTKASG